MHLCTQMSWHTKKNNLWDFIFFQHINFGDWTSIVRISKKCHYPLSHFTKHILCKLNQNQGWIQMIRGNISFLNRFVYLFLCKWVSFLHIFMYIMWVPIVCRGKKRASDPLRLKLLVVVSCHLYIGSCNQILCNSNKCFWLLTKSDFQVQLDKIFLSNNIKLSLFF